MLRKTLRSILPPIVVQSVRQVLSWKDNLNGRLFDGDDLEFKAILRNCQTYMEYGCGASTLWVNQNSDCRIYSTDTSKEWIERVKGQCAKPELVSLHHANLGKVGAWGRPETYDFADSFPDYTDCYWRQGVQPDVVLIDGRFRVCCFLTSLLNASEGTRLIFDDYRHRQNYHIVESYLKPEKLCGRQAIFIVPAKERIDSKAVSSAIERFRFVMD